MVKVVHIGMPFSGVGNYINQSLYKANYNFDFYLLCNLKQEKPNIEGSQKIKYKHISLQRNINPLVDFLCLVQIIRYLIIIKPNIVHCHSSKPGLLVRIATTILSIPTFYTPHAFAFLNAKTKIKSKVYLFLERILAKLPAKILACSEEEQQIAISVVKCDESKVLVWENSIRPVDKQYNIDLPNIKKEFSIASVGRICYQKNYQMAVEVMNIIKKGGCNLKLNIYGAGYYSPEKEHLKQKIKQLGLEKNIIIHDYLERSIMAKKLSKNMLYISTSRYEGLPYSVMEAMSLSMPSVVTDVEGNNELVKDGINGYLIDSFNPTEMASKILELIDDNLKRELFGKKAKQIFNDEYNIENNIKKLERLYLQYGR
jgi:glycosyltransferase involved in cell wall biosynthesis